MKRSLKSNQFWFFASLISLAVFYLTLTWKSTQNIDLIVTNSLYWGAIFLLLWRRHKEFNFSSDFFSTTFGLVVLTIVLIKSISFFWFESSLFLPLTPVFALLSLLAIAFKLKELRKYWWELLLSVVLFFPSEILGWWFNRLFQIQILTAKFANYLLYYFGFNTISQNYDILLHLPDQGYFTASVNYSCTGVAMIILMFKLALVLESLVTMKRLQRFLFPIAAVIIGFMLGVIRVTIMTVLLPEPDKFNYWHGTEGAQIFSTTAIVIFSSFCYLQLKEQKSKSLTQTQN